MSSALLPSHGAGAGQRGIPVLHTLGITKLITDCRGGNPEPLERVALNAIIGV